MTFRTCDFIIDRSIASYQEIFCSIPVEAKLAFIALFRTAAGQHPGEKELTKHILGCHFGGTLETWDFQYNKKLKPIQ